MLNFLIFYFTFCGIISGTILVNRVDDNLFWIAIFGFLIGWIYVPIKIGQILEDF